MEFDDRPQLPLTPRRIALVALGFALFAAQVAVAWYVAQVSTGEGIDGSAALAMIACSVPISIAATLRDNYCDILTDALSGNMPRWTAAAFSWTLSRGK